MFHANILAKSALVFYLFTLTSSTAQEVARDNRPALPFPPGISLESQCGQVDDLQHVEFYDGTLGVNRKFVDDNEDTAVQLQWLGDAAIRQKLPDHLPGNVAGARWCTGTLIDANTVLTAGHCFDIQRGQDGWVSPFRFDQNGQPVYAKPEVLSTLLVINFGYQLDGKTGLMREPNVFPITKLIEHRLNNLDFAIIELGANAEGKLPADLGHKPGIIEARDTQDGELLAIIQHPQGDPKKIEAGSVRKRSGSTLFYDNIDTHGGSSGSGVRDADGEVIAVHTHGGCQQSGGANSGVLLEAIAQASSRL